jgi:hypothetical protein
MTVPADAESLALRLLARPGFLRGRQKALAADTLWGHEQCAEALSLRRDALAEAVAAARILADDRIEWGRTLDALGLTREDVADAQATLQAVTAEELPALDTQLGARHDAHYLALRHAHETLDRALATTLITPADGPALRVVPAVAVVALVLVGGALGARILLREERTATASAQLEVPPGFPPAKALDGDATTEWLLPHATPGWIDVRFGRPRALRAVKVLNAHNRGFNDLATHDYRIEAFAGERAVGSAQGSFAGINPAGPWARHPIEARGVTRVRVWVDTFHGAAGGLGEIDFE